MNKFYTLLLLCIAIAFASCSKDDDNEVIPSFAVKPWAVKNIKMNFIKMFISKSI